MGDRDGEEKNVEVLKPWIKQVQPGRVDLQKGEGRGSSDSLLEAVGVAMLRSPRGKGSTQKGQGRQLHSVQQQGTVTHKSARESPNPSPSSLPPLPATMPRGVTTNSSLWK